MDDEIHDVIHEEMKNGMNNKTGSVLQKQNAERCLFSEERFKKYGPQRKSKHGNNSRQEDHATGKLFVLLILLREHCHRNRSRHGRFKRADHQRHGRNME